MKRKGRMDALWFFIGAIALWQVLSRIAGEDALSSPWQTLRQTYAMLGSPAFWGNVEVTFEAFAWGLIFSLIFGVLVGLFLGFSRFAAEVGGPLLESLYSIPKITLYPVILLFFGLGMPAKVAFGVIHGIFPVILFTMNGVLTIKPVVRKTARIMHITRWQTISTILLPAALPEIFSGLRIGFSLTLLGTLIGELFASTQGIGFLLLQAANRQDVPETMALVVMLFVVASSAGAGLLAIDRRLRHSR